MANGPFTLQKISFEHWADCVSFSNGIVDVVIPESFGPRIMRFGFCGGPNVLKIFPASTPGERVRGGHRLWVAPEIEKITWVNDTAPVQIERRDGELVCTGAIETVSSFEKQMRISLEPGEPSVRIVHRVTNRGSSPAHIAPWALTQMAPGGTAFAGLPPRGEHPRDLLPNGSLVLWPYTDLSDARWGFLQKYIVLRHSAGPEPPQKFGMYSPDSWCGWSLGDLLFVKRATTPPHTEYPDMGCSLEIFTNPFMTELETLAALCTLHPGDLVEHTERWMLQRNSALAQWNDHSLDQAIAPLLSRE